MEAVKLQRLAAESRERRRKMKRDKMSRDPSEVRGPFADYYRICGRCRHFEIGDQRFEASNLRVCAVDGREHWKGADACEQYEEGNR